MDKYTNNELGIIMKGLEKSNETITRLLENDNRRIGKLETWRSFIVGGLSVVAAIVVPLLFLFIRYGMS